MTLYILFPGNSEEVSIDTTQKATAWFSTIDMSKCTHFPHFYGVFLHMVEMDMICKKLWKEKASISNCEVK